MIFRELRNEKEQEYTKYIHEHQKHVSVVWQEVRNQFNHDPNWEEIDRNINKHDASKFSKEEYYAYRSNFYPVEGEKSDRSTFLKAWNHHQKVNKHHWEHWILRNNGKDILLDMDYPYVVEMLCDWTAMGLARPKNLKNSPQEFYEKNTDMKLSSKTKKALEKLLPIFNKAYHNLIHDKTKFNSFMTKAQIERIDNGALEDIQNTNSFDVSKYKSKEELEYIEYVKKHKENIGKVWQEVRNRLKDPMLISQIDANIQLHDNSKFNKDEFDAYRRYYHPKEGEGKDRQGFLKAWNNHQKMNKHHWEHWILYNNGQAIALDMEKPDLIEMLCDWTAKGMAKSDQIKNSPIEFYKKSENMELSENTSKEVESWLPLFQEVYKNLMKHLETDKQADLGIQRTLNMNEKNLEKKTCKNASGSYQGRNKSILDTQKADKNREI